MTQDFNNLIKFTIGDKHHSKHGKTEIIIVKSNYSRNKIQDLYILSKEKYGLVFDDYSYHGNLKISENIWYKGKNIFNSQTLEKLKELGLWSTCGGFYYDFQNDFINSYVFLDILLKYIKLSDSNFIYEILEIDEFVGYIKDKNDYIGAIGFPILT